MISLGIDCNEVMFIYKSCWLLLGFVERIWSEF